MNIFFIFDLQLFGGGKGGGSSTTVQAYQPTAEERRLWNQQANYSEAVAPNALKLNNYAMGLLRDSLGTVQVDYNTMNKNAQNQINNAMGNMAALASSNNNSTAAANEALRDISTQTGTLAGVLSEGYNDLKAGNVPSAYQANMEKSIQSALANTMGKAINNLGNRGVLDSSVTNEALNDIERNAADAVAQQYQQNISQSASLLGSQGNVLNDALGRQGELAQQQFSNQQANNSQNSGIYSNLINSATVPITTAATSQDAAISPAQALWSSSLGLNNAGTSALGVMGGKGTTTSTQTYSNNGDGGMGFFSGLLNAGVTAFCFVAGTEISMADGTKKKIQEVKAGDKVKTENGSAEVIEVMEPHYNDVVRVICENAVTTTTGTQPIMGEDGKYILVSDLKLGTKVKAAGKVLGLLYVGRQVVYDFKTNGENQYIADGFIAMGGSKEIWGE